MLGHEPVNNPVLAGYRFGKYILQPYTEAFYISANALHSFFMIC